MATAGPFRTIPFIIGTGVVVGQGLAADPWLLYSTDPVDTVDPEWTDATGFLRGYNTSRGRPSELARVDAGTMKLRLDDRTRVFDPDHNPLIRPMNQWQLFERFSGETHSVFKGYAESYQEEWVKGSQAAWTNVSCVDEFKALALDRLPATDPPRSSYDELVAFDTPTGHWPMNNAGDFETILKATVGPDLNAEGGGAGAITQTHGAIVGEEPLGAYLWLTGTNYVQTPELTYAQPGDAGGLSAFTIETWLSIDGTPSSTELLLSGPDGIPSHTYTWKVSLNTSSQVVFEVKNSGGTVHTVTSGALTHGTLGTGNVWYHVVCTIEASVVGIYIDGAVVATTAWTGTIEGLDNAKRFIVGNAGTTIGTNDRMFDEIAFYRTGFTAERVLAHYQAGRERGFFANVNPEDRVEAVLDAIESIAPRNIRNSAQGHMTASYMKGQPPLDELRKAESVVAPNGVLFVAKDGTITFYDENYRSAVLGFSLGNTVQATFDDDGTDLPYQDIELDYSEAFLFNEWNVTKVGGTTTTATDATSIADFGKRSQSISDLPVLDDATQGVIATQMKNKYKDPMRRVTKLTVVPHTLEVLDNIFRRELGDKIRVLRTPPGGGARIDQSLWIQSISVDTLPGHPRRIVLGVSPL